MRSSNECPTYWSIRSRICTKKLQNSINCNISFSFLKRLMKHPITWTYFIDYFLQIYNCYHHNSIYFAFIFRFLTVYKKIHRFTNVISYFATREWEFRSYKMKDVYKNMSKEDKEIFFCELERLDWDEYFKEYLKGIRVHLMQDPLDTLEAAKVKWNR